MSVSLMRCSAGRKNGFIGVIHLHISETIKFRMPKVFERLMQLYREGTIELSFSWSHKKITCLDTTAGYFVVEGREITGKMQWKSSMYSLKNKEVYEFRSGRSGQNGVKIRHGLTG